MSPAFGPTSVIHRALRGHQRQGTQLRLFDMELLRIREPSASLLTCTPPSFVGSISRMITSFAMRDRPKCGIPARDFKYWELCGFRAKRSAPKGARRPLSTPESSRKKAPSQRCELRLGVLVLITPEHLFALAPAGCYRLPC